MSAVQTIAVGTGQALDIGRRGDCDVVFVHDPDAEEQFVREGYGMKRHPVMYNDFVIVGPRADPAKARGSDLVAALKRHDALIALSAVIRGDTPHFDYLAAEVTKCLAQIMLEGPAPVINTSSPSSGNESAASASTITGPPRGLVVPSPS